MGHGRLSASRAVKTLSAFQTYTGMFAPGRPRQIALDALWLVIMLVPIALVIRYVMAMREERYLDEEVRRFLPRQSLRVRRWL